MASRPAVDEQLISEYLKTSAFIAELSGLLEDFREYASGTASSELDERTRLLLDALAKLTAARTALQKSLPLIGGPAP